MSRPPTFSRLLQVGPRQPRRRRGSRPLHGGNPRSAHRARAAPTRLREGEDSRCRVAFGTSFACVKLAVGQGWPRVEVGADQIGPGQVGVPQVGPRGEVPGRPGWRAGQHGPRVLRSDPCSSTPVAASPTGGRGLPAITGKGAPGCRSRGTIAKPTPPYLKWSCSAVTR